MRFTAETNMPKYKQSTKTRFPEISVSGSPKNIGNCIGEEFRDSIKELSQKILDRHNKGSQKRVTIQRAREIVNSAIVFARSFMPAAVEELEATAESSGVPFKNIMLINVRSMLSAPSGCTSVIIGSKVSKTGQGMIGQNWDNDPEMAGLSAVITRHPIGKPSFITWCQPGIIAYMGFNDKYIGICMNALNGPTRQSGVGWYFLVRSIFEQNSTNEIISLITNQQSAMSANAALITEEGPLDLEITPDRTEILQASNDKTMVHTNHCVHPSLVHNNKEYKSDIYGQSFARFNRAEYLLETIDTPISLEDIKRILSDRQGYPTSINRYPNEDPETGWQRSVVSLIFEPKKNRMHLTNGNPGDNPYETYMLK